MNKRHPIIEEDLGRILAAQLPWNLLDGKTVLVTGASGFIPAYTVETLLRRNEIKSGRPTIVLALVRNRTKARNRFEYYKSRAELVFLVQDVCDPIEWDGPIDYVIHAASHASPKYYGIDPVGTFKANTIGTYRLLEIAREKKVEGFLYVSSGEVYGQVNEALIPITEDTFGYLDPAQVRSSYAESKRMGETMCVAYAKQYLIPTKIVRPFHTYGPGMSLDDGRVFADFVSNIVHRKNIVIKSDGKATRAFCYLADAVQGIFTVLLKGQTAKPYNLGDETSELSILALAELLVDLFPDRKLRVVRETTNDGETYLASPVARVCPDVAAIKNLGWKPTTSVSDGFARTVRSFE